MNKNVVNINKKSEVKLIRICLALTLPCTLLNQYFHLTSL